MALVTASILDRASDSFGRALPSVGGALLLLVGGLLLARLVRRLLIRGLLRTDLDGFAERAGVHMVLERIGLERSLSRVLGRAVGIGLSLVVVFAALSLLGLEFLSTSLNEGILFLPRLLLAFALVIAGIVLGELARVQVERVADQMDLGGPLGRLAELAVLAIFVVTALTELGVPTAISTVLVATLIAAVALTFALAFGLGGREVAREVSAGRYVSGAFAVGQTISVEGVRGRIAAFDTASTVLESADGRTLRVPNHLLLDSVVAIESEPPSEPGQAEG